MDYILNSCVWEITLACNYSCKYCGSRAGRQRDRELNTKECLLISKQLADLGCKRVSLIGGEVFLRRDWDIIAAELAKSGVKVSIITNGSLINDDVICRLFNSGVESVAISLDSVEEIHDKYRTVGSFRRASDAIDYLGKSGIPVSVISTVNAESANNLYDFFLWLQTKHIFAWQIQACSPMGNANSAVDYRIDQRSVIDFVSAHLSDAPFTIGIADNIGYFTEEEGYLRGNQSGFAFFQGCQAGITTIGIDSVGNVRGCESMYDDYFIEGNLRDSSLQQIWNSPDNFSYNRKFTQRNLSGKCATCRYSFLCKGGCRSYNYFSEKHLFESSSCALLNVGTEDL